MLQQVRRLAEDLHTLRALEGPVLGHHALVLVRVGQVRYVVAARSALVPSLAPYLQGGLLGLNGVLLAVLGLLQGGVWLQDHSVHGAAQRVVGPLGERVHDRGWSHCMLLLLLPRLRHPSAVAFKSSEDERGGFQRPTERDSGFFRNTPREAGSVRMSGEPLPLIGAFRCPLVSGVHGRRCFRDSEDRRWRGCG